MKHAIYQMEVVSGNPTENFEKVRQWTERTMAHERPDVLVLPELWSTSYAYEILTDIADDDCAATTAFLSDLAAQYRVNLVGGSIANKSNGKIYNTALVFDRTGKQIYRYDKVHLASSMEEHLHFFGGNLAPTTFLLDGIRVGLAICYDLRFPEIIRPLAVEGARVLYLLAAWPLQRVEHWSALLKARAIENQFFVVGCGRPGVCEGTVLAGSSCVFDPFGHTIGSVGEACEETMRVDLDLEQVDQMRHLVAVFEDRHPEFYLHP